MAIFAIPNPKKSTIVDFPVDRIKISVKNIPFKTGTTTFTFQGWDSGVGSYNGGGVAKYKEYVLEMIKNALAPTPANYTK